MNPVLVKLKFNCDLMSGYRQIKVAKEDHPKTAFVTEEGYINSSGFLSAFYGSHFMWSQRVKSVIVFG